MEEKDNNVVSIESGMEIVSSKNKIVKKRGGKLPGAGRKPREKSLTNYHRAVKMLDDSVEYAIDTMIRGLADEDPAVRFKCAEFLINKSIINRKQEAGSGEGKISKEDMEVAVDEVMAMIASR